MICDLMRTTWKTLIRNKTRSLLTIMGIMVGVIMVLIVTTISQMGTTIVMSEMENMGMNGISVCADSEATPGKQLTVSDLEVLRGMDIVEQAMPLMINFVPSRLCNQDNQSAIFGIDAGGSQVISLVREHGRLLNDQDIRSAAYTCVVDEAFAKETYQRTNITGKTISLNLDGRYVDFKIVGVAKAGSSILQNVMGYAPTMLYLPYTTLQNLTGITYFDQIAVKVRPTDNAEEAEQTIVTSLRRASHNGMQYRTENLAIQKDRLTGVLSIITIVLTLISGISLVVSGVSIMTIMLSSVSERTKEIGIKKAIGATRTRILLDFLAESIALCLIGAVGGILVGEILLLVGSLIFGLTPAINLTVLFGLIGFSMVVGAVFGVYPAMKAAKLQPVEALRNE